MPNKIRLVHFEGPDQGKEHPITGKVIIGRGQDADICLDHPSISRHHCEIWEDRGVFYFKDLGSTNGVFHNNKKVAEGDLVHGDRLRLGDLDFDIAEGAKPVRPRSDEDLLPGKRKKPKPKLTRAQRMRRLIITFMVLAIVLLGIAGYQAYLYRTYTQPINWTLKKQPFVHEVDGFQMNLPAGEDWGYSENFHISESRDWRTYPPELGNGLIIGNEIFDAYHIHQWIKEFPGEGNRIMLMVEVLAGVSRERTIHDYTLADSNLDLPKFIYWAEPIKPVPKFLSEIPWAQGNVGEEYWLRYPSASDETKDSIYLERGYVAFGNRFLITIAAREDFIARFNGGVSSGEVVEGESIHRLLESFRATPPQREVTVLSQRDILEKAQTLYRQGKVYYADKFDYRKLYNAFEKFRDAALLFKQLEEEPFEARQLMKDLTDVHDRLQARLEEIRRSILNLAARQDFEAAMDQCETVYNLITNENEEWHRWAKQAHATYQRLYYR